MLTKADLEQIGEVIDTRIDMKLSPLLDAKLKPLSNRLDDMVTKDDLSANNRIFGTIVRTELASTKREIVDAVKAGFQEMVKQTKQRLDDHETRLTQLEDDNTFLPH